MNDLLLDLDVNSASYGDFLISGGDIQGTPNQLTAIQQHILQRLRTFQGEWFLDNTVGIPFFQQILVKNPNIGTVNGLFISEIRNTPGVASLTKYGFVVDTPKRRITASFRALTTSGVVDYSGTLAL